jgi:hypothetical protein
VLASAAISALVLPRPIGEKIATDGAWVRNFPLGYAYDQPGVELIVSFRYLPSYPRFSSDGLSRLRHRLERFPKLPPVRALIDELREAEERDARGEPAHWGDMILRLMRVAVQQNTSSRSARGREGPGDRGTRRVAGGRRGDREARKRTSGTRVAAAVDERFAAARFPFGTDRLVPRIAVSAGPGAVSLEAGLRNPKPWSDEAKHELIARGYELLDAELRERAVA